MAFSVFTAGRIVLAVLNWRLIEGIRRRTFDLSGLPKTGPLEGRVGPHLGRCKCHCSST